MKANHIIIVKDSKLIARKNYALGNQNYASICNVSEPHQYSSSLSRNPSISRSSAEGSSTSTNDQVFGHGFVNPANLESLKLNESSIQEWLSDPKLDERLRSFRYFNAPSLQRERPVKEVYYALFI